MSKSLGFVVCLGLAVGSGCATRLEGSGGQGDGGQGGGQTDRCANLLEAACKASPSCRAEYCSTCACAPAYVGCAAVGTAPKSCSPAQSCPVSACSCTRLNEADCKAAAPSLGCTPAYCPDRCDSGPTFATCQGPNDTPPSCTGSNGCGQNGCHQDGDCAQGTRCATPGCVACHSPPCASDSQCGTGQVCQFVGCCQTMQCVPRCTEDSCAGGSFCDDGHCVARTCTGDGACPPDFSCLGELCTRHDCNRDGDCASGDVCVHGLCFDSLGTCLAP